MCNRFDYLLLQDINNKDHYQTLVNFVISHTQQHILASYYFFLHVNNFLSLSEYIMIKTTTHGTSTCDTSSP